MKKPTLSSRFHKRKHEANASPKFEFSAENLNKESANKPVF